MLFAVLIPFQLTTLALTDEYWVYVSCSECQYFNQAPGSNLVEMNNLTLAYLFTALNFFSAFVQILTRISNPECSVRDNALLSLDKCGVPREGLVIQDQNNCDFCENCNGTANA